MNRLKRMVLCFGCFISYASTAIVFDPQKIIASDRASQDRFGWSTDIKSDLIVVGAVLDDENGQYSGSSYIFEFDGNEWLEKQKINPDDGAFGDWFGSASLIIDQNTIAVSARSKSLNNVEQVGAVYIFKKINDLWVQSQKLVPPGKPAINNFGKSISVYGDNLFISAIENSDEEYRGGAVFIFNLTNDNWEYSSTLNSSDLSPIDFFGYHIKAGENILIVSAYNKCNDGIDQGAVYVFEKQNGNWVETQKLIPKDIKDRDNFGSNSDLKGDFLFIGSNNYTAGVGDPPGSLYIYKKENGVWKYKDELINPLANSGVRFGRSSSYQNGILAVETDETENGGLVSFYECKQGQWIASETTLVSNDINSVQYGSFIQFDKSNMIISDPFESNPTWSGSAQIFKVDRIFKSSNENCY